jgi:ankyrin repeat protein
MSNYFKIVLYLYVFIGFSIAKAGAYDDFFKAIEFDQADKVQQLLERGFDANSPNPKGQPALIYAMQQSSKKVVELIVNWPKTDLSVRNQQGETPLMLAALQNNLAMAKLLISKGADVNQSGWTPLHYAATKGHVEMIRLMIENHAYLDAQSPNGTTPLMMAAHYGSAMATKLLLEEGADPRIKNKLGLSAWDFAHNSKNESQKTETQRFLNAFLGVWAEKYPKQDVQN